MTISELIRTDGPPRLSPRDQPGQLHDEANRVDEELLPCRINNPSSGSPSRPATWSSPRRCAWTARPAMCLDGALERREPWGVWGGQLFLQAW